MQKTHVQKYFFLALGAVGAGILFYFFAVASQVPLPPKTTKPTQPEVRQNPILVGLLDDYSVRLDSLMKASATPGAAVCVVKDSTVVMMKGLGVKSLVGRNPVDVNTVFRLASVSKCFASMLAGSLAQDGLLEWDAPILKYCPSFSLHDKESTSVLTVRHVLSHTTGLPYHTFTNLVEEGLPLDTLLGYLKNVPLSSPVGKTYSYQNVGYSIIGPVVEALAAKPYPQVLRERIFEPLHMSHASASWSEIQANANTAMPHHFTKGGMKPMPISDTYYNVAPAGGVNASIGDMAKWMVALFGHRPKVIKQGTLQDLFKPQVEARSRNRNYRRVHPSGKSFYAMGWRVMCFPNDTLVYHGGYVNGYRSEVGFSLRDQIGVCILTNAVGELADQGIPLFFTLLESRRKSILAWEEGERAGKKPLSNNGL